MAEINRWWARSDEIYWLEVTQHNDIGTNLKSPQADEHGKDFSSYSLIKEIKNGDLDFHYDGKLQAIVTRSVATGLVLDDEIVWTARGLSARSANIARTSGLGGTSVSNITSA